MRARNSAYTPTDSIYPFEGLDYQDPSTLVDVRLSPEMENMNVDRGHLASRFGYKALAGGLDGTTLAIVEFETVGGVVFLVAITTTREYKYNTGTGVWDDITYRPFGGAIVPRTGTEENGIRYSISTGFDSAGNFAKWLIITNGVDKPRYWDGSNAEFWLYSTAVADNANRGAGIIYTSFNIMEGIVTFSGYTFMVNVTTTANEPTTVAWSDTGSLTNFGTGAFPGNSGAIPLTDAVGPLRTAIILGDRLMIYADDTVHVVTHVGGTDIFSFERILNDTRLASSRAIVDINGAHLYLGQENFYLFDGTRNVIPLGEKVALRIREELQPSLKARAWGFLDKAKNQVYWGIPRNDVETIVYKMEYDAYDFQKTRWAKHIYASRITTMGFWRRTDTLRWNASTLVGVLWSALAMNWDQGSLKGGFHQRMLGYVGGVGIADDTVNVDGTSSINSFWDSVDFTAPGGVYETEFGRWSQIELETKGGRIEVLYSVDQGGQFTSIGFVGATEVWDKVVLNFDVVSKLLRIRLRSVEGSKFEARWLRLMSLAAGV